MKKTVFISLCLILSAVTASANFNVEIDDEFNIIAGNSETLNLTLTSDKEATVHLSHSITPDDIGFEIIFSDNDFTFKGIKTVETHISTHNLLAPDNYVISIDYTYEVEQPKNEGSGGGTVIVGGGTDDDTDDTDTGDSTDDQDETDDEPTDDDTGDSDTDDSTNGGEGNDGGEGDKADGEEEDGFPILFLLVKPIIALILLIILLFLWNRRTDDEDE